MSDYLDSVNDIIVFLGDGKRHHEKSDNRERAIQWAKHEQNLRAFITDYQSLEAKTRPIPVVNGDDLSDLPAELLKELSATKTDELETQIVTIINASDGVADIDTILINLFRRYQVVQTRKFLQNKLWRMTQKEILWSVEGKKGSYTSLPPVPADGEEPPPLPEKFVDSSDQASFSDDDLDDEIPF